MLKVKKSVYEQAVYESGTESRFVDQLEKNLAVKVYAKLPGWFTVPTPLGSYNPDWAVLIDSEEGERLYFVVETKGSLVPNDLRGTESAKIKCGEAHFNALKVGKSPARYELATSVDELTGGHWCGLIASVVSCSVGALDPGHFSDWFDPASLLRAHDASSIFLGEGLSGRCERRWS